MIKAPSASPGSPDLRSACAAARTKTARLQELLYFVCYLSLFFVFVYFRLFYFSPGAPVVWYGMVWYVMV